MRPKPILPKAYVFECWVLPAFVKSPDSFSVGLPPRVSGSDIFLMWVWTEALHVLMGLGA